VRTFLHLLSDAVCAVLNVASIAIAAGTIAAIFTHRLRDGVLVALAAFVVAGAGFGYGIWRTYRPQRQMFRSRRFWRTAVSARS
jgi:O-antigen/teichoic acid export membrane protein